MRRGKPGFASHEPWEHFQGPPVSITPLQGHYFTPFPFPLGYNEPVEHDYSPIPGSSQCREVLSERWDFFPGGKFVPISILLISSRERVFPFEEAAAGMLEVGIFGEEMLRVGMLRTGVFRTGMLGMGMMLSVGIPGAGMFR